MVWVANYLEILYVKYYVDKNCAYIYYYHWFFNVINMCRCLFIRYIIIHLTILQRVSFEFHKKDHAKNLTHSYIDKVRFEYFLLSSLFTNDILFQNYVPIAYWFLNYNFWGGVEGGVGEVEAWMYRMIGDRISLSLHLLVSCILCENWTVFDP